MPMRAHRICVCGYRIASGAQCMCERARAAARKARHDEHRPSARKRGYDAHWEREAKAFLARPENRYCACGCGRRADTVDHDTPHKGDKALFWDRSNWRAWAFGCHSRIKQSRERRKNRVDQRNPIEPGGGAKTFEQSTGPVGVPLREIEPIPVTISGAVR